MTKLERYFNLERDKCFLQKNTSTEVNKIEFLRLEIESVARIRRLVKFYLLYTKLRQDQQSRLL